MSLKGDRGPKGVPSSAPDGAEERLEYLKVVLGYHGYRVVTTV